MCSRLLLIAPAVIFMVLVVGVPFGWAIYLSLTDAIGGLAQRQLGRLRQLHERLARRELPAGAPQHADLHDRLAGARRRRRGGPLDFLVRDFRGKWFVRFLVVLPWAAPVVLSTITWLWLLDSLYSVVNWTLGALHLDNALIWLLDVRPHRGERAGAAAVARPAEPRPHRDHARARVADPALRGRDLHRRARLDPERGRGRLEDRRCDGAQEALVRRRPAAAPDRARRGALRHRVHRRRLRGRLHPHRGRAVQLDAGAADVGVPGRDQLRLPRRGSRHLPLPLPAPHRRQRRDALLRAAGPGDADERRARRLSRTWSSSRSRSCSRSPSTSRS